MLIFVVISNELSALRHFKEAVASRFPLIDFRLFGSKARGDGSEESDLDIMIVTEENTPQVRAALYDLCFEIDIAYNTFIICHDIHAQGAGRGSSLGITALQSHHERRNHSMTEKEKRVQLARFRLQQSDESIDEGYFLLSGGKSIRIVINRAYYAMFYATLALLIFEPFSSSKHSSIISYFTQRFLKSRIFPEDRGTSFLLNRRKSPFPEIIMIISQCSTGSR